MSEERGTDWSQRAQGYDRLQWVGNPDTLEPGLHLLREMGLSRKVRNLLEVGAGTGALTEALLLLFPGALVLATDKEMEMLKKARRRLQGQEERVILLQSDEVELPSLYLATEPDKRLARPELVISRMMLHHALDPRASVKRWAACLPQAGGWVVVIEGPPPSARGSAGWAFFEAVFALKEPDRHIFSTSEVGEWMMEAGAEEVTSREWWSGGNSVKNWLKGSGLEESLQGEISGLHRAASSEVKALYQMREVEGGDIEMRWRHGITVGRF